MPRAVWLLIILAFLAGCDTSVKPVPVPQVVRVQVPVYVPVPAELTQDCPIAEAASLQVEEVVRIANARKVALQNCNVQMQAIRNLVKP
ncbi:Rz1-like lysis system protein LysC [Luteibacter aegosomaticola]|uniref:Rz1-like lysis system protein LysC n=1 Tax=Luteibacter aegosomaticola TaxID=2911538 RepID=UPI003CCE2637